MSVVDASVWVSYLVYEDEHHAETRAWIDSQPPDSQAFSGPSLLLVEVAGAIARRTNRPETALRLTTRLSASPLLQLYPMNDDPTQRHVEVAARLRLGAADVLYVVLTPDLGVPLVTWDRHQRERASALVEAMTPAEALARGL